jgi:hypothetical protein
MQVQGNEKIYKGVWQVGNGDGWWPMIWLPVPRQQQQQQLVRHANNPYCGYPCIYPCKQQTAPADLQNTVYLMTAASAECACKWAFAQALQDELRVKQLLAVPPCTVSLRMCPAA